MIVERRLTAHIDWPLIAAVIALSLVGLATIYSATYDYRLKQAGVQFWAQVYALPVAIVAMLVLMLIDYGTLTRRSILLYGALVLGLLAVLSFGVTRGGAKRWISIGGATLQPSEFARIVLALTLAAFYGTVNRSPKRLATLVAGGALLGLPAFLIYKQPDLGTAVTLIPVFLGIVYLAWWLKILIHPFAAGSKAGQTLLDGLRANIEAGQDPVPWWVSVAFASGLLLFLALSVVFVPAHPRGVPEAAYWPDEEEQEEHPLSPLDV